jgi:predicted AlkP superfamily pyrophosphatase or phosphodiesterase
MKKIAFALLILTSQSAFAQNKPAANNAAQPQKPKLVVGIVVDQMRWDYLYRYAEKYGSTGFKRLQSGYNCENTHIPYVPSITGPGHTCVYTGSVPAIHGIIANEWYNRDGKNVVNCISDTSCRTIGATGNEGQASPHRLLATTITDELRLATNFHSKVIGVAAKDRAAILPAGHAANAAYWFDGESGRWISSSYYMDTLPAWVNKYNAQNMPAKYAAHNWQTLLDISKYTESAADDEPYERPFRNQEKPVFPHMIADEVAKNPEALIGTPFGNTMTLDFAKTVIQAEQMGRGSYTDFLAISCSSTDYIGHQFGPNSVEAEDCYLRLDRDLGDFLSYLDKTVGAGNYVVFLSADHGASHSIGFNKEHKIPAGAASSDSLMKKCNDYLSAKYGYDSLIEKYTSMQIYLHYDHIRAHNLDVTTLRRDLCQFLMTVKGVAKALNLPELTTTVLPAPYREAFINGYNQKRSGDIQIVYEPGWLENYPKGTTHSAVYAYDTHIPLLWYGWGIRPGHDYTQTYMTDIAATLAAMLHIQEPSGCIGKPIEGVMRK